MVVRANSSRPAASGRAIHPQAPCPGSVSATGTASGTGAPRSASTRGLSASDVGSTIRASTIARNTSSARASNPSLAGRRTTHPRSAPWSATRSPPSSVSWVWMLAVDQIIIPAYSAVGRWMPGAGTLALLQLGPAVGSDGKLSASLRSHGRARPRRVHGRSGRPRAPHHATEGTSCDFAPTVPRVEPHGKSLRLHDLFCGGMRSGLWLSLFEELADPGVGAAAADAEDRGWHGVGGVCGRLWRASAGVWIVSSGT